MSLSPTHIAFLAIISIFTGLVAPGTESGGILLSYLMTDARWIVYLIFMGLVLAFLLASMRSWRYYRVTAGLLGLAIIALAIMTWTSRISSTKGDFPVDGFSWGWTFLIVGVILLYWSYHQKESLSADTPASDTIDTVIGMLGGFALACIAGIIALSSFSFFSGGTDHEILTRLGGSGAVKVISGEAKVYGNYESMPHVDYARSKDRLLSVVPSGSGNIWTLMSGGDIRTGELRPDLTPLVLGDTVYSMDKNGYAYSGRKILLGSRVDGDRRVVIYKTGGLLRIISDQGEKSLEYKGIIGNAIRVSDDASAVAWIEGSPGKKSLIISGVSQSGSYDEIHDFSLSSNGKNVTSLVSLSGKKMVMRNSASLGTLPPTYISGSYQSNGTQVAFLAKEGEMERLYYNFEAVSTPLEDIREVFLEKDGTSYAYFGRPVGVDTWCLFTRYKGNICGLEGYMNPQFGADGGSVIWAGKKGGIWSIYRNTDIVVKNTGYNPKNNAGDYAYYDPTKPQTYLFIEKNPITGDYQYRKNGALLPTIWKDVSTEVHFGYDDHIITTAQDKDGWKILEL